MYLPLTGISLNTGPIGVTDSGVGGLTVLRAVMQLLPAESFVYLADSAYMPYGEKPEEDIRKRVANIQHHFANTLGCKATLLACNTATAAAADALRAAWPAYPIVGIEPAVKPAAMYTQTGVVGILATNNTLASERFKSLVGRFESVVKVYAEPCPGLVELIEALPHTMPAIDTLLRQRLGPMLEIGADVVVLGCTHYPFIADRVKAIVGDKVQVIETGMPVAKQLQARLINSQALAIEKGAKVQSVNIGQRVACFTTGQSAVFRDQLIALMGEAWATVSVTGLSL